MSFIITFCMLLTFIVATIFFFKSRNAYDWWRSGNTWLTEGGLDWIMFLKGEERTKNLELWKFAFSLLIYIILMGMLSIVAGLIIGFTSPISIPFLIIVYIIWRRKNKQNEEREEQH